jgi:Putative peptidoglycan binding domain
MPGVGKQVMVAASCLLIALGGVVRGQGSSPVGSPGFSPKNKSARTQGPKLSIKSTPPNNQNQANAAVRPSYSDALRRYRHERHNRFWWKRHFTAFVLSGGGYYYWDAGYWCPAWGYDSSYENYDYDGPIYTYGNLLPDQVIVNVQRALKQLGYYTGGLTGSLGPAARQALADYQQDAGLDATGAIDAATVEALGLANY